RKIETNQISTHFQIGMLWAPSRQWALRGAAAVANFGPAKALVRMAEHLSSGQQCPRHQSRPGKQDRLKHPASADVSLNEKVAFLSRTTSYASPVCQVARLETHMSWVFLAGDEVYKLKKPLRYPYLDFSTLARREAACRAELTLNHRLAPDVYKAVTP